MQTTPSGIGNTTPSGACTDFDPQCPDLKDYCDRADLLVNRLCRQTCNLCGVDISKAVLLSGVLQCCTSFYSVLLHLYTLSFVCCNYNNNEYLERLTRTGPKRLHVLYKYIFIVKIQRIQHECTHTRTHAHRLAHARMSAHSHTHTHTHTYQSHIRAIRAMRLKKRF